MTKVKYSVVTTAPAVEPIQRDELVKLDLKLSGDTIEDDLLDVYIQAAREYVEDRTGRSLITQTRLVKLDYFPPAPFPSGYYEYTWYQGITLTHGRVQEDSIVIKYYDTDDVEQTVDAADYWVDTHSDIARVVVKNAWPSTSCRPNAVSIEYVAGYGDDPADVPAALRRACLLMVGHFYENRQEVTPFNAKQIPAGVDSLLATYIITQYAGY